MMSSIKKYTVLVALLSLSVFAGAQQVQQQTAVGLDSVLRQVVRNNPMLLQYGTLARAREAEAQGATAWMAPMVGAGLFMAPYPGQEGVMPDNKGSLMISAEQAIPNPAKQQASQAYYNSRAALEEERGSVLYNQLRAEVKQAYYNWLVLERKMAVLEESERIMEFLLKLAKVRFPYSQGSLSSIYLAEARQHQVENMQLMTLSEIAEQRLQLNILMNISKEAVYLIDTTVALPPAVALELLDTALLASRRSDVALINRTINTMQLGLKRERLERKPDFRIRFDHMSPLSGMMPQQFTLMGMVTIPVAPWSARMYKANTRAMELEIQAMEEERVAVLNEAEGMARSMAIALNTMRQQVINYQTKIIPALRKNYETTLLAYEQNTAALNSVVEAWEALNMAHMEYLDKLQSLYQMAVAYEREVEQ